MRSPYNGPAIFDPNRMRAMTPHIEAINDARCAALADRFATDNQHDLITILGDGLGIVADQYPTSIGV